MDFSYERVLPPEVFEENRQRPHSDHSFVPPEGGSFRLSLDGDWQFHYAERYEDTVKDFADPAVDCSGWPVIQVPGHIQLQGYGRPQYVNIQYPWDGREAVEPGEAPRQRNPVGSYVKIFTLPEQFRGKRVIVSFQGAESGLAVWLNGAYVGYGEDGYTPSEFELTPYLREGENKLAVQVFQWTAASWCEDQDFFRFSGLFRSVYLYAVPESHIWDLRLKQELSEDFSRGTLTVESRCLGKGSAAFTLEFEGETAAAGEGALGETVTMRVDRPRLWSAEDPALYTLRITVRNEKGRAVEEIRQTVGFRRFGIVNGIMTLNGKRLLLRGVNRHEFSCTRGRAITEDEIRTDILTMKRNNINAVRTSHYPNQSAFYDLCDRYGLYVMDEMNLEAHGSWSLMDAGVLTPEQHVPGDNPRWRAPLLARAEAMVERDKNHPCVLIWSCGNESYGGENLLEVSRYFHRVDDRPVHYEGATVDKRHPEISDLFSNMYFPAEMIREQLQKDSSRPAVSCEYGHAMGNAFGGQKWYLELTEEMPAYQGGFIWDYMDQALLTKNGAGQEILGYGGDFNDRPNDGNFSGNGIVYSLDRTPSPKMPEVKALYQELNAEIENGNAHIQNRYLFTNSDQFDCVVELRRQGAVIAQAPLGTRVAPGTRETYRLPLWPADLEDEYTVILSFRLKEDTLWAPKGHEVAFSQRTLGRRKEEPRRDANLTITEGDWNIGVQGPDFRLLFSRAKGLISWVKKDREMIRLAPRPNFWRAPTDNDRGWQEPTLAGQWKLASLYQRIEGCRVDRQGETLRIRYEIVLGTQPESRCSLIYRVAPSGVVETELAFDPGTVEGPLPEFGVAFSMGRSFDRVRWYGPGPEESYCDRHLGLKMGIYETSAADGMAGYLKPQECGNHWGTRWAEIREEDGTGLRISGQELEFSALPYTPHELEYADHPAELPKAYQTVVKVSRKQMGLGADDSWGARPQEENFLRKEPAVFRFILEAVGK